MKPEQWILEGETGISSKTIWAVMTGVITEPQQCDGQYYDVPHDPDDFSRCYKLITLCREWKPRLNEVGDIFPKWQPFIREWATLEKMYFQWRVNLDSYHQSLAEYHHKKPHRSKPKFEDGMYDFMQTLYREGMLLDGWIEDSPHSYHRDSKEGEQA